jgi:hypothetical protein
MASSLLGSPPTANHHHHGTSSSSLVGLKPAITVTNHNKSLSLGKFSLTGNKEPKVPADNNFLKPTTPTYIVGGGSSPSKGKDKANPDCKVAVLGNVGVGKSGANSTI